MAQYNRRSLSALVLVARLPLFSCRNFRLSLHWSWLILLPLAALPVIRPSVKWLPILDFHIFVFAAVLFHELGHILVARLFKLPATEIVLWPGGGLCIVDIPKGRLQDFLVTAAGPAANFLLAAILSFLFNHLLTPYSLAYNLLTPAISINLLLAITNLFPVLPLDGGRIAVTLLSFKYTYARSRFICTSCAAIVLSFLLPICIVLKFYPLIPLIVLLFAFNIFPYKFARAGICMEIAYGLHLTAVCPHCGDRATNCLNDCCESCRNPCNMLEGKCWNCGHIGAAKCIHCGQSSPIQDWNITPHSPQPSLKATPPTPNDTPRLTNFHN